MVKIMCKFQLFWHIFYFQKSLAFKCISSAIYGSLLDRSFHYLITTYSQLLTVMGAGKQVVFSSSTLKVRVMNFSTSLDHQISQISFTNLENILKFGWFFKHKKLLNLKIIQPQKFFHSEKLFIIYNKFLDLQNFRGFNNLMSTSHFL